MQAQWVHRGPGRLCQGCPILSRFLRKGGQTMVSAPFSLSGSCDSCSIYARRMALMRVWYPRSRRNQRSRSASRRMVMISFGVGSTTFAIFQNCSSVARASGSAAIPLRILAALTRRSRAQSVPVRRRVARFGFDPLGFNRVNCECSILMQNARPSVIPNEVMNPYPLQITRSVGIRLRTRSRANSFRSLWQGVILITYARPDRSRDS